jgi:acyl carrier protein
VASISSDQIEDAIKEILATELEVDMGEYGVDAAAMPLLGRGIGLDSIDALTLITALEKRFDIEVGDEDLTVALFKSIRVLAEYVARKSSEAKSETSSPAR